MKVLESIIQMELKRISKSLPKTRDFIAAYLRREIELSDEAIDELVREIRATGSELNTLNKRMSDARQVLLRHTTYDGDRTDWRGMSYYEIKRVYGRNSVYHETISRMRPTDAEKARLQVRHLQNRAAQMSSIDLLSSLESLDSVFDSWIEMRPAPGPAMTDNLCRLFFALQCVLGRRAKEVYATGKFKSIDARTMLHKENVPIPSDPIAVGKKKTPNFRFPCLRDTATVLQALAHLRKCMLDLQDTKGLPLDTGAMGQRLATALPRLIAKWFTAKDVSMKMGRYLYVHLHALHEGIVAESDEDMLIRAKAILGHDSILCTLHYVKINSLSLSLPDSAELDDDDEDDEDVVEAEPSPPSPAPTVPMFPDAVADEVASRCSRGVASVEVSHGASRGKKRSRDAGFDDVVADAMARLISSGMDPAAVAKLGRAMMK